MRTRVAVVADLAEERWPSMDLVAAMLAEHLPHSAPELSVTLLRPPFRRRAMRVPVFGRSALAYALDRYSNRYGDYAWWLRRRRHDFDVFHVVDHSYAHLVTALPGDRTIVTCHDIDAFRCLTEPGARRAYRHIARRILIGLRRAAFVTCDTRATRDELVQYNLLSADRLVVVPNGVHPAMFVGTDNGACSEAGRLLGSSRGPELLHVGSTIARKRIDVLLEATAIVRRTRPAVRLLHAGARFTTEQRALASQLGLANAFVELPSISPEVLAAVYRRATITLLTSDREGFGLPVVESLACGTPVVASRIPALVEVGGDVTAYAPAGDADAWALAITSLLEEREQEPAWWAHRREAGRRHAASFTWPAYARAMTGLYAHLIAAEAPEAV